MQILDNSFDQVTPVQAYMTVSVKQLILDTIAYQKRRRAMSLDEARRFGELVCDEEGCRNVACSFDDDHEQFACDEHLPPTAKTRWEL